MYILTLFLSSLFLSHHFLSLARSLSLSRSVSLFLSSLLLSLAVSLKVFVTWYLYVSRTRARLFSSSQTFSVLIFLSLFLSCSPALSFSFYCIGICTYQSWKACTQPHLSGFALRNSLEKHLSHPLFALFDICCCQQLTQCEALVHPCDSLLRCCRESTRTLPFTGAVKVNSPFSSRRDIKIDVCK